MCQCPSSGFSHFYYEKERYVYPKECVNALLRASLISTSLFDETKLVLIGCQCPSSGFSHFYIIVCMLMSKNTVSMPFFGLLSFLHLSTKVPNVEVTDRVNALLRASLISTLTMSLPICRPIVSMPFFGLLSFLRLQRCGVGLSLEQVSMPFFGLLSFLPKYQFFMEYLKNCVALLRASLISTLRKEI